MNFSRLYLVLTVLSVSLLAVFLVFRASPCSALSNLIRVSDTLSTSHPDTPANHTIKFIATTAVPPSGTIDITLESGAFDIPTGFDYTDIDLATSSSINATFTERTLGSSPSPNVDGVTVVTGGSGSITFTLSSNRGLAAGTAVRIKLGTNAVYGASGDLQIQNPVTNDSFRLYLTTYDASSNLLDRATTMVATVSPVDMGITVPPDTFPPYRYNGFPSGSLPVGTKNVSLSMNTDEYAYCKYATEAGVPYASSTNWLSSTLKVFHSTVLTDLVGGLEYNFYIRCQDILGNTNDDDYLISFYIPSPGSGEGETGSTSGGGGGAPFPPLPSLPALTVGGWAFPLAKVFILKDGNIEKEIQAGTLADFTHTVSGLEVGVYTFSVWARDSDGRKSVTESTTFLLKGGTRTTIRVFLPPTIEIDKDTLDAGDDLMVFGQSVPDSTIDVWIHPYRELEEEIPEEETIKMQATADKQGRWSLVFDTAGLLEDTYVVQARSSFEAAGTGDFGQSVYFGIGKPPVVSFCERSDLNQDGSVNLVDFSILLYHWKTSDAVADINMDGMVDLVDFSIMMYCWTG